jgi:hypothetical protein
MGSDEAILSPQPFFRFGSDGTRATEWWCSDVSLLPKTAHPFTKNNRPDSFGIAVAIDLGNSLTSSPAFLLDLGEGGNYGL